jgi:hypothetical protein
MEKNNLLPLQQSEQLLKILKTRFEKNMHRHNGLEWAKIESKLDKNPEKLRSLNEMEETGGEPDVVGLDAKTGKYIFLRLLSRKSKRAQEYLLRHGGFGIAERKQTLEQCLRNGRRNGHRNIIGRTIP